MWIGCFTTIPLSFKYIIVILSAKLSNILWYIKGILK